MPQSKSSSLLLALLVIIPICICEPTQLLKEDDPQLSDPTEILTQDDDSNMDPNTIILIFFVVWVLSNILVALAMWRISTKYKIGGSHIRVRLN
jgi:hypothetical protein